MYPAPKQDFGENCEILNQNPTNQLGFDNSNTCTPRIFDQVYNSPETNSVFANKFLPENCQGLFAYGRLYNDQLFSKSTPAQKCVLATITNLCESPWAKAHGNAINLENWVIGYRTNHVFNAKTIGIHINDLADLGLVSVETKQNVRWLSIIRNPVENSEDFLPIIALDDKSLTYQESILLSALINASCVYARADLNFILPNSGIKNICDEFIENKVFSKRTIRILIDNLENKGLIASIGQNGGGLQINHDLAVRYGQLFNVDYSYTANELLNTRAVAKVVRYVDNPLTRTIRAQKIDLVPNGINPIDVINTKEGILYVEKDGFVDINGQKQPFNTTLPYYENTLEQCNSMRKGDLFYKVDSFELTNETELSKISRNEFYALNEKDQWIVTLDNVLNTPEHNNLAQETEEAYRLTTSQLNSLLIDGISLPETRKPLSAKPFTADAPFYSDETVVHDREHMLNCLKSYEKHSQDKKYSQDSAMQTIGTTVQTSELDLQTTGTTVQTPELALCTPEQTASTTVQNAANFEQNVCTTVQNVANFEQNVCTYKNGKKNDLKNGDQEQKKEREKERIMNDPKNDAQGAPDASAGELTLEQHLANINSLIDKALNGKKSYDDYSDFKSTYDEVDLKYRARSECPILQVAFFNKQNRDANDLLSFEYKLKYTFTETTNTGIDSNSAIEGFKTNSGRVVIRNINRTQIRQNSLDQQKEFDEFLAKADDELRKQGYELTNAIRQKAIDDGIDPHQITPKKETVVKASGAESKLDITNTSTLNSQYDHDLETLVKASGAESKLDVTSSSTLNSQHDHDLETGVMASGAESKLDVTNSSTLNSQDDHDLETLVKASGAESQSDVTNISTLNSQDDHDLEMCDAPVGISFLDAMQKIFNEELDVTSSSTLKSQDDHDLETMVKASGAESISDVTNISTLNSQDDHDLDMCDAPVGISFLDAVQKIFNEENFK